MFLEIWKNSQENTFARVSFLIKKETPAQVLSFKSFQISKNTFCYRTPFAAASAYKHVVLNKDTHVFRQRLCSCEYFIYTPGFAE